MYPYCRQIFAATPLRYVLELEILGLASAVGVLGIADSATVKS